MRRTFILVPIVLIASSLVPLGAAVVRREPSRFDGLVIHDPVSRLGIVAETPEQISDFDDGRAGWAAFRASHGESWTVSIDRRSGAPLLVQGPGLRWFDPVGPAPGPARLEAAARAFLQENETVLRVRGSELVLDADSTAMIDRDRGIVAFDRVVDGVPVEGQRFLLHVVRGNLVSFGTGRWGEIGRLPDAVYGVETTRELLYRYMGLGSREIVEEIESGVPVLVAAPPVLSPDDPRWSGPVGQGITFRLARRFALRVSGEPGTWVGKVDSVTGDILAFYDDDKYAQVKGWVYPRAADGDCAEFGCLLADYSMPYANMTVDGSPQTTNDAGMFECTGGTASTSLIGPYVRINDNCGAVNESVACDEDLDLGGNTGTNCTIPAGRSPGDTNAARTAFWDVNRIKEKGRYWLPANTWLQNQVQVNVNVNSTCNATWSGQLNMYRAGNGCRNTAETAGVLNHEFGHGLDQNDGGGYDNPSEAYADVVAILYDRASCVGRGFFESQVCSGYGDTCLSCTGIRDMDWDARVRHTPATPANFTQTNCGGGSGPCGKETHCESYPPSEALYDLAARDLPAAGLDTVSAWQLAEKLFLKSRQGAGGAAFNCSLPNSDGCNANGWYNTMRIADDDDGNLANGTPHGAALFAAFNRHAIACGTASAPENQSTSSCPSIQTPTLTALNGSNAVTLDWNPVPNAANYLILRADVSCDFTQNVIATVPAPATTYVDTDLPNGFTFHYKIQAQGANTACESAVSACAEGTPQPFAGTIKLNQPAFACSSLIQISVTDANVGASTTTAEIWSSTETTPETVVLTETAAGSSKFVGTIQATGGASTTGDGLLAIGHGGTITATYVDLDDGQGGSNLTRQTSASADCVGPQISQIQTTGVSDVAATVTWTTDESSSSLVNWGESKPPANVKTAGGLTTAHSVPLTGLQACTVYYYSVESRDAPGNTVLDDRSGQYYSFETLGNFGEGLQPCRAGKITVLNSAKVVSCSQGLELKLVDLDLNADIDVADTATVEVSSSTEPTPELVVLTETGPNTSVFRGSIVTAAGGPVAGDGFLQAANGDFVTATYRDASAGTGIGAISFDTAVADCVGPVSTDVRVTDITDDGAVVRFATSEPATARVDWGLTPALDHTVTTSTLATSHALTIGPLNECGRVYFRAYSTDTYGNTRVYDDGGAPYAFNAYIIPGIFRDTFESASGWTLEGDWQIGTPQGLGTSPGDPAAAFEGTKVLGQDLTGLGTYPGDYEPSTNLRAISPVINASALSGGQLKIRRWLNVSGSGVAYIEVKQGGTWYAVWNSPVVTGVTDSAWSLQTFDIASFADANSNLQIAFRTNAGFGGSSHAASWNVDRLVVKSANQPANDACGGCGGTPTFAGVRSAADVAGCVDSGVALTWNAAPAWGSGHQGTYVVYRDTDPNFTPSASNRIAFGVTGTTYTDLTAPNDANLYYIVRAENDETCSTGPNNGGVTDQNLVRLLARDDTTQPNPGDVGSTLMADPINEAHVRLSWAPTGTAAKYRVYRSQSSQGPFSQVAEIAGTLWEDRDQMGDSANRYYKVRAVDSCGNEGP